VLLTSPEGERFEFIATLPSAADCVVNQLKTDSIEDIRVICEYPNVFPDDLPGMPPECDIEFIIDLLCVLHLLLKDHIECQLVK
jgi:hypothetical protein